MKEFLVSIGINIGLAVSGMFGSLLLIGNQKDRSLREQIISVIGGTMAANYITPVVIVAMGITEPSLSYGVAFIVGFSGLKIVEAASDRVISKLNEFRKKK
jgi:hypothetical protein